MKESYAKYVCAAAVVGIAAVSQAAVVGNQDTITQLINKNTSGVVWLEEGTYNMTKSLKIEKPVVIRGAGKTKTFIKWTGTGQAPVVVVMSNGVTLRNLGIDAKGVSNGCVKVNRPYKRLTLNYCQINNGRLYGAFPEDGWALHGLNVTATTFKDSQWMQLEIYNRKGAGFSVDKFTINGATTFTGTQVSRNFGTDSGNDTLYKGTNHNQSVIEDCIFHKSGWWNIDIAASYGFRILNNKLYGPSMVDDQYGGTQSHAIHTEEWLSDCVIKGNEIWGSFSGADSCIRMLDGLGKHGNEGPGPRSIYITDNKFYGRDLDVAVIRGEDCENVTFARNTYQSGIVTGDNYVISLTAGSKNNNFWDSTIGSQDIEERNDIRPWEEAQ